MPSSPAKLPRRKYKKFMTPEHFFEKMSAQNNFADPKLMGDFYLSMVKVIMDEIKAKGYCRLPFLGDFAYVTHKKKFALMGKRYVVPVDGVRVVKFYPAISMRAYFSEWNKNHHVPQP